MKQIKLVYVVYSNVFYKEGVLCGIFELRKDAEKAIRSRGFRMNKNEGLFINNKTHQWCRVDGVELNKLSDFKFTKVIVTNIKQSECGCWEICYNGNPWRKAPHCPSGWVCSECGGDETTPYYGFLAKSFRAIEEKPQYMTFEKIHKLEKEEVLINN